MLKTVYSLREAFASLALKRRVAPKPALGSRRGARRTNDSSGEAESAPARGACGAADPAAM